MVGLCGLDVNETWIHCLLLSGWRQVIVLGGVSKPLWRFYHHCGLRLLDLWSLLSANAIGSSQLWTRREQKVGLTRLRLCAVNIHQSLSHLPPQTSSELSARLHTFPPALSCLVSLLRSLQCGLSLRHTTGNVAHTKDVFGLWHSWGSSREWGE